MISNLEYIAICTSLVSENQGPNGWIKNTGINQSYYENNKTGFKSIVYEKTSKNGNKDIIIAFNCMDDNDWNDKIDAFLISQNLYPRQYNDAWNLYIQVLEYYKEQNISIHFTGWSLGGALAQLMGKDTLIDTVTFSAPGMANYLDNPSLYKDYTNITNYCIMNDPIGNANQHIGITYLIEPIPISTNIIADSHQYSISHLNIETNQYKYILKPNTWTNQHTMALIKYDINFNIETLLNNTYLINTYTTTNEQDLNEAIDVINLQMGATSTVLYYKTNNSYYVLGTDNNENGENALIASENNFNNNSYIWGNGGNDVIKGLSGNDILIGDSTTLTVQELEDLKNNKDGINVSDFESENDGNDTIYGGDGDDLLFGCGGNDELYGEEGNDTIYGGKGDDTIVAGSSPITSDAIRSLAKNNNLVADNFMSFEKTENKLYGGEGEDVIIGDSGNDIIHGDDDKDYLYGGDGNDKIYGDGGDDYLNGGKGNDTLYGGEGNDIYSFAPNEGSDIIKDLDGNGKILSNGTQLFGSSEEPISDNVWRDNSGNMYFWNGSDESTLLIRTIHNNNITVENFKNGDLGIYLKKPKDKPKKPEGYFDNASKESSIAHDPIIFDLNSDGVIETTDINNGTHFDHDNNGFAEATAWVGEKDGILVVDTNSNNKIDNGTELVLHDSLASYDTNNDGIVDENDTNFNNLKILKKDGSLLTLSEAGISSINTNSTSSDFIDDKGNSRFAEGSFTRNDGTTGMYGEYMVQVNTANSKAVNLLEETDTTIDLPNIAGRGNVYSLHQAILRDESNRLSQLVTSFTSSIYDSTRRNLVDYILEQWTDTNNVIINSRGANVNAKHLAILEKFMGRDFWSTYDEENGDENINPANPNKEAAAMLETAYELLKINIYAELMSQTHLKDLMSLIVVNYDEDEKVLKYDLKEVTKKLQEAIAEDSETGRDLAIQFVTTLKGLEMNANSNYFDPLNDDCLYTALTKDDRELKWQFDIVGKVISEIKYDEIGDIISSNGDDALRMNNAIYHRFHAYSGNDVVYGGCSYDDLLGCAGDDILDGGDGQDYIFGHGGNDIIFGGKGNDFLFGGNESDTIYGGEGNDTIHGDEDNTEYFYACNDILIGGKGNDTLIDLGGNEIYIFNLGDGQDTMTDKSGADYIKFGPGISWEDLTFTRNENDMIISINNTTDQITVKKWFDTTNAYSYEHNYKIEQFRFDDGSIHSKNEIEIETTKDTFAFIGTNENDSFTGTFLDDTFEGKGGDNDAFYDDAGGNDTYIYNLGDGWDWIYDKYGYDTIQLGEGITASMLTMNKWDGGQLEITFDGYEGNIVIDNYFNDVKNRIERIVLSDGTEITDFVPYFSFIKLFTFNIGDGSKYIDSLNDINAIRFGEGITTENINLLKNVDYNCLDIYFDIENANDDHITIENCFGEDSNRIEELFFADGTEITNINQFIKAYGSESDLILPRNIREAHLWGNNNISAVGNNLDNHFNGNAGDNTITGGRGNDSFWDEGGNDTYIYNIGDGYDYITDIGGSDTIQLGEGITASMLTMNKWDDGQLEITFDGIEGNIVIDNYFNNNENKIEKIILHDGTEITDFTPYFTTIETDVNYTAPENSKVINIIATGEDNISLTGKSNDNHFEGNCGNNTFEGKQGNDSFWDEAGGNDTYIYNYGDGWDWIHDKYGNDTIQFGEGISTANTQFVKQNNNLEIRILDENGWSIGNTVVEDYFDPSNDYKIETVKFADGTTITDFSDKLYGLISETENVVLTGNQIEGSVWGDADLNVTGNDLDNQINGNAGNNVMTGCLGNDSFWDEAGGNDTYIYKYGDGWDWIHDRYGNDTIQFGEGITLENTQFMKQNNSLEIRFLDENNNVIGNTLIDNYFDPSNEYKIETVKFADGTVITDFSDKLHGIISDSENIVLTGNQIEGSVWGDADLNVTGNDLANQINGNAGNNVMTGSQGNDSYWDEAGGNDTYVYNIGDGYDWIHDKFGYDTIQLGEGITASMLTINKWQNGELEITFDGIDGNIVIDNYFNDVENRIERIVLSDGTEITDFSPYATFVETDSDYTVLEDSKVRDIIAAGNGNISLTGNSNNNNFYGNSGNNTFEGKGGNDSFFDFQGGNDTYIYNLGDGNDYINDIGGNDTIKFGAGINLNNIGIMRDDYNNMHVRFENGQEIIIQSQYDNNENKIENIEFSNGTVISNINALTNQIGSEQGNIVLPVGYTEAHLWGNGNYSITGNNDDNFIRGNAGNNVLEGKGGNDNYWELEGGNDTYIYSAGDGYDWIQDQGGNDTISFGSGISLEQTVFTKTNDNSLLITFQNQEGHIWVNDYFNTDIDKRIENFSFADGTVLTDISDILADNSSSVDVNQLIQEMNSYAPEGEMLNGEYNQNQEELILAMS